MQLSATLLRIREVLASRDARIFARWLRLTLPSLGVALIILFLLARPAAAVFVQLALLLVLSLVLALVLTYGGLHFVDRAGHATLRLKFAIPAFLVAFIMSISVSIVALLMLVTARDSLLIMTFLGFGCYVAFVLARCLAYQIGLGLERLELGAQRIADGDYSYRLPEAGPDGAEEIWKLAMTFNKMASMIESTFKEREAVEMRRLQFIEDVTHDLRAPLTSVVALSEAIEDGVVDAATAARYQQGIYVEARRLRDALEDLFHIAQLEAGSHILDRAPIAIAEILADVIAVVQSLAEQQGVAVLVRSESDLPDILVDRSEIERVLTNLLHNALRHTPRGGGIMVRALRQGERPNDAILVQVLDSGEGIAIGDLPHIFDRGYHGIAQEPASSTPQRTAANRRTGIGLAVARAIVEAHGGQISARSPLPPDEYELLAPLRPVNAPTPLLPGALFDFTLPIAH